MLGIVEFDCLNQANSHYGHRIRLSISNDNISLWDMNTNTVIYDITNRINKKFGYYQVSASVHPTDVSKVPQFIANIPKENCAAYVNVSGSFDFCIRQYTSDNYQALRVMGYNGWYKYKCLGGTWQKVT